MEKSKEKGESVTSSKEVLPILSSMAVEKGSRKARRGRRDGIALLQHYKVMKSLIIGLHWFEINIIIRLQSAPVPIA